MPQLFEQERVRRLPEPAITIGQFERELLSTTTEVAGAETPSAELAATRDRLEQLPEREGVLEQRLADQVRAELDAFTAELESSDNLATQLTVLTPKLRAFWRHRSVRLVRMGLSFGLSGASILAIMTGAIPVAIGALGLRTLIGGVSSFLTAQEVQERWAHQRETGSVQRTDDATKTGWDRLWGGVKTFFTDNAFGVSEAEIAAMNRSQARVHLARLSRSTLTGGYNLDAAAEANLRNQLVARIITPYASKLERALRHRVLREVLGLAKSDTRELPDVASLAPAQQTEFERGLQSELPALAERVRLFGVKTFLEARQTMAETRLKRSATLGVAIGSLTAVRGGLNSLVDAFTPSQLEDVVGTGGAHDTVFQLNHVANPYPTPGVGYEPSGLGYSSTPGVAYVANDFPAWVGEGPVTYTQPAPQLYAQYGAPYVSDVPIGVEPLADVETLIDRADFASDVQRTNFRTFMDKGIHQELSVRLHDITRDPTLGETELRKLMSQWAKPAILSDSVITLGTPDGGTVEFSGYDLDLTLSNGQTLGEHLVENAAEYSQNPVKLYELLSLNESELASIPVDTDGLDITAAYDQHEATLFESAATVAEEFTPRDLLDDGSVNADFSSNGGADEVRDSFEVEEASEVDTSDSTDTAESTPSHVAMSEAAVEQSTGAAGTTSEVFDGEAGGLLRSGGGGLEDVKEAPTEPEVTTAADLTAAHLKTIREKIASQSFASQVNNEGDLDAVQSAARDLARRGEAIEVTKVVQTDAGLQVETELAGSIVKVRVEDLETGTITGASITPSVDGSYASVNADFSSNGGANEVRDSFEVEEASAPLRSEGGDMEPAIAEPAPAPVPAPFYEIAEPAPTPRPELAVPKAPEAETLPTVEAPAEPAVVEPVAPNIPVVVPEPTEMPMIEPLPETPETIVEEPAPAPEQAPVNNAEDSNLPPFIEYRPEDAEAPKGEQGLPLIEANPEDPADQAGSDADLPTYEYVPERG